MAASLLLTVTKVLPSFFRVSRNTLRRPYWISEKRRRRRRRETRVDFRLFQLVVFFFWGAFFLRLQGEKGKSLFGFSSFIRVERTQEGGRQRRSISERDDNLDSTWLSLGVPEMNKKIASAFKKMTSKKIDKAWQLLAKPSSSSEVEVKNVPLEWSRLIYLPSLRPSLGESWLLVQPTADQRVSHTKTFFNVYEWAATQHTQTCSWRPPIKNEPVKIIIVARQRCSAAGGKCWPCLFSPPSAL